MTELVLWTLLCWAILLAVAAFFRDSFGRHWKRVAWGALAPAILIALGLVFLAPPIGGYDPLAARFWISRAASEADMGTKEAYLRRVAFASPEHGWYVAAEAIGSVEDRTQRCRLRTLLAALPGIRNRQRLGNEARDECNAALQRDRS